MTASQLAPADLPLVSIGLPTHNRSASLARAIDSALAQTHQHLELVISDNASTDSTPAVCHAAAARDPRVRYLRRAVNAGPTANFNALFEECRGDFVMMLADDDWLEADYVQRCLQALRERPERALVCGIARYFRGSQFVSEGVEVQLSQPSPAARVRGYYRQVRDNGNFYGLMPRPVLRRAAPLPNVLGNDWLLIAAVAFQGEVHTLRSTAINRALEGTSSDIATIAATFGVASFVARIPDLVLAGEVLAHILWRSPVYAALGPLPRLGLAASSAASVVRWRSLAWHLTAPTVMRLGRRRRGRALYRAYDRLTRRLGAAGLPPQSG